MSLHTVQTPSLHLSFHDHGSPTGWPILLTHGFPYSPHSYASVIPRLLSAGARVLVPYVRGFGPTRFRSPDTPRSGQQAALATDLIDLLNATGIEKAIVAGFDWGGVASCAAALLYPERVAGLVSYAGYDIVNPGDQREHHPSLESVMWYQHLLQHDRGKSCLEKYRRDFCLQLWREWSPTWTDVESHFEAAAPAFENPDFVDVVAHAYRYAFGNARGDPSLQHLEDILATRPKIQVPAITLDGRVDPLKPGGSASHDGMFEGRHERRVFDVGHAFPLEEPVAFAEAILKVREWVVAEEKGEGRDI